MRTSRSVTSSRPTSNCSTFWRKIVPQALVLFSTGILAPGIGLLLDTSGNYLWLVSTGVVALGGAFMSWRMVAPSTFAHRATVAAMILCFEALGFFSFAEVSVAPGMSHDASARSGTIVGLLLLVPSIFVARRLNA
jgi:hypothetical protein